MRDVISLRRATLQRYSQPAQATTQDYDNVRCESYDNVPETQDRQGERGFHTRSKTLPDAMGE